MTFLILNKNKRMNCSSYAGYRSIFFLKKSISINRFNCPPCHGMVWALRGDIIDEHSPVQSAPDLTHGDDVVASGRVRIQRNGMDGTSTGNT